MSLQEFILNLDFASIIWQVSATLLFMLGDIVSGFISAIINKNVYSQKMREGILRKLLLLVAMGLSFVMQHAFFNINIISKFVCLYIIFMEIISILENLTKAGIDFGKLGEILRKDKNYGKSKRKWTK